MPDRPFVKTGGNVTPETAGEVVVLRDVMVAMRDGVRLATDIFLPAARDGPSAVPLPVILERTPYGKTLPSRSEVEPGDDRPMSRLTVAMEFVRAGYVVVCQDCRGRHGSEGVFAKYLAESDDGFDCCAWIVAQPWCDGRIGSMGLSYAAHAQLAMACVGAPGLATMILDSGGFWSAWREGVRQGGAFELKQATWAYRNALESPEAAANPALKAALEAEDIRDWFRRMPWSEGRSPLRAHPAYEAYLLEQWRAGTDGPFWRKPGIRAEDSYDAVPDIPVLLMSSWYDAYSASTFANRAGLVRDGRRHVRTIMGPWLHGDRHTTASGDASFGPAAAFSGNVAPSWLGFRRRWFDRWLKGRDDGADRDPPLGLFLMGGGSGRRTPEGRIDHGGRWIEASDWPPPGTRPMHFHLHRDGLLSPETPAAQAEPLTYLFDPADPTPTIGGQLTSGRPVFEGGGFDQRESAAFFGCREPGRPLADRADVLVFQTEALAEAVAVVGPIRAVLHVASDAPDTDFTVKLIDVHPPSADYPDGYALNLTDGILRCRYRRSPERPEPLTPGEPAEIEILPPPNANLFAQGHRIRIDVSSSNFPKFDVNPNSFEPEGFADHPRIARNTVFCDALRPSHVVLPVAPASVWKPAVERPRAEALTTASRPRSGSGSRGAGALRGPC